MELKGMDKLSKHVPELNSAGGRLLIAFYASGLFALITVYFILSDHIPTWSIDSQIIVMALGFLVLGQFFSRRQAYKKKYEELAFRNAFAHFIMPGLALIMAAIAHAAYMNGPFVPHGWWTIVILALGWYFFCIGSLLWLRSIFVFGADNLTLLYVYHPEEGRIIDSNIYGILRHPVYAGAIRVSMGLAMLNGNANALAFAILAPLGFIGWIRLVEERELIERFGMSYLNYRKHIPAFWPRIRQFPAFFRFLFLGK